MANFKLRVGGYFSKTSPAFLPKSFPPTLRQKKNTTHNLQPCRSKATIAFRVNRIAKGFIFQNNHLRDTLAS